MPNSNKVLNVSTDRNETAPNEHIDEETPIEVAPFLELTTVLGTRVWIRKSSVTAVKEGVLDSYRVNPSPTPFCTVTVIGGSRWDVAGSAKDLVHDLGQAEL